MAKLYALTAVATSAGSLAGPALANYGHWMAYGIQAAITAAVALPAGYWFDSVIDSVTGLLANDSGGRS